MTTTLGRLAPQDQAYRIGRAARIRGLDLEADELMQQDKEIE